MQLNSKKGEITLPHLLILILSLAVIVIAIIFVVRLISNEDTIEVTSLNSYKNIVASSQTLFNEGDGTIVVNLVKIKQPWVVKSFAKGNYPCRNNNCICICNGN